MTHPCVVCGQAVPRPKRDPGDEEAAMYSVLVEPGRSVRWRHYECRPLNQGSADTAKRPRPEPPPFLKP